jgi:hypothetical protein
MLLAYILHSLFGFTARERLMKKRFTARINADSLHYNDLLVKKATISLWDHGITTRGS